MVRGLDLVSESLPSHLSLHNNEKNVRGEAGMAGNHAFTLKSDLGYIKLES